MKQKIWTEAYSPFIMGGDVNQPIATEVEVGEAIDIGHGYKAYVVVSPSGVTHVAEAITGAFIEGSSIEAVKESVSGGDPKLMKQQIEYARTQSAKARTLNPEDFWSKFESEKKAADEINKYTRDKMKRRPRHEGSK